MLKGYFIAWLGVMAAFFSAAQTVTPVLINVKQLAQNELLHPPLLKPCVECNAEETDGGWRGLQDMPLPKDANIKTQFITQTLRPQNPNTPLTASPAPNQTFAGELDPGKTIPPDTHGAVGINHVVNATNDFLKVLTKNGTLLSSVSINSFTGFTNTCDPYILFDPASQRWFYTAIECGGQTGNQVVLLVSATADPTGNWLRYAFVPNVPGGSFFLDHPYLGFDNRWVVISGRKFPSGSFTGPVLFVLDKANLIANGLLMFGTNAQAIEKNTADGDSPLPVTLFGTNPNPNTFYILQNWNAASSTIRLSTITGDIPNATWNTAAAVFPSGGGGYTSSPGDIAEQTGESRKLSTNDARISSGVMVNGNIWCAQHVGITATNVAVQWWQLSGNAGSAFGNILQRGRVGEDLANNYRWFPSIAVNNNEDVILGYTVSSSTSLVSSAYSFRTAATPANTMLEEQIYKPGLSTYYKTFGGTSARWGDYSHSAIDPVDGSLWTVQQYAGQRTGTADNQSKYGVWWAQVLPISSLVQRDAGVGQVTEPAAGLICSDIIHPQITLRNFGTDTLKSVQVVMLLDDVPQGAPTTFNNLSLVTFASSAPITLTPDVAPAAGMHTLKVFTQNPNGSADLKPTNDTLLVNFTIANTLSLPYAESFEAAAFPPPNGSAVINENGGSITWVRSAVAASTGGSSMVLNAFNYLATGDRDTYRTPKINVGILDSLVIDFNVAYKQVAGFSDSLTLVYSEDCGATWLPAGYSKGGAGLSTSPGLTTVSFIPAASEWRAEHLVLKNFCATGLQSLMIGFQSYNDHGNNIYVDDINITGFVNKQRNTILRAINHPSPALCSNILSPDVSFSNAGTDTIRSLKINYQVDAGPVNTFNWTGALAKCTTAAATLNTITAATGTHILTVFTSAPNGFTDEAPANDTLRKTFTVYNTTALPTPVFEGFETTDIPRTNWGIQNPDGLKTWARTTAAAKTGIASLWINNGGNNVAGSATDYFISPVVANNAGIDSMFVSWDDAYKTRVPYPGSNILPVDTLEVLITQDCGATFTSVWKKTGEALQTTTDTASNFVPGSRAHWRAERVWLTPYTGTANFQVYFVSKSNQQNNLWLDNVNISSKTLPLRLKNQGYLIYPSPFVNTLVVHHILLPTELRSIQVYNAAGQLVWAGIYNGNANTEIPINLPNVAAGVYIIRMSYSNKIVVEKLVKQ